ncbi:MAG TPA: YoaK family protein, partial [Mycobacterium sp.]|nr:YoaK family protein [Mycobacterium sp.]
MRANRDAKVVVSLNSGEMTISSDSPAVDPHRAHPLSIHVRNGAAMFLAAASGATDAIGYLALGNVFTSAMTGNLALLGIALAHRDGERVGRVLVSLACYMVGR